MNNRIPNFWGNYEHFHKNYLAADFSPRRYFRWQNGGKSFVLMDSPDLKSLNSFMVIDKYLRDQSLSAPEIIEADTENGFLLLEDFGDATFTKVLQNSPKREWEIYKSAVNVLVHLQERTQEHLPFLKFYDTDFGLNKVRSFLNHYYPAVMQETPNTTTEADFITAWRSAINTALESKKTIFLRDYHVDNLMDLPHKPPLNSVGLLDFQDAVWAPIAGDLVSLLHDARRDVPKDLRKELWNQYLDAHPKGDHQEIFIAGTILSAVRHTRIIGLFTRKAQEGSHRFLQQIPHLWALLQECCSIEELKPVWQWFNDHFPESKRMVPS